MKRSDERKQVSAGLGASVSKSPYASREKLAKDTTERVSREATDREDQAEERGEDSSLARSKGAAKKAQAREMSEEKSEEAEGKRKHETPVKGGRGIEHGHVEADHVFGANSGSLRTDSAEGRVDGESSKGERKEAMEPERAANEQAATKGERTIPTKNTMGHGERETVGRNTI